MRRRKVRWIFDYWNNNERNIAGNNCLVISTALSAFYLVFSYWWTLYYGYDATIIIQDGNLSTSVLLFCVFLYTTYITYFQDVDITDNPLVIIVNEKKEMKAHFLVHDKFEETKYEVLSSEDMWKQFLHVRLNTILPLTCEATISGVKNILQNKRKKVYLFKNLQIFIPYITIPARNNIATLQESASKIKKNLKALFKVLMPTNFEIDCQRGNSYTCVWFDYFIYVYFKYINELQWQSTTYIVWNNIIS